MRTGCFHLLGVLALSASSAAEPTTAPATAPAEVAVERPAGAYEIAWLDLKGGPAPIPLFLAFRENRCVQAWLLTCRLPGGPKPDTHPAWRYDRLAITRENGRLAGEIGLRLVSLGSTPKRTAVVTLALQARVSGERVSGTWSLTDDAGHQADGDLLGTCRAAAALAPANALAPGRDWPTYLGPAGVGRGSGADRPLVDDLARARPLWRSEEPIGGAWGTAADARAPARAAITGPGGGAASPVVADGKVYVCFYRPRPPVPGEEGAASDPPGLSPAEQRDVAYLQRPQAEGVVLCADAATGQTLWKATWPPTTANLQTTRWRSYNPTPTVADGALFVADYANRYAAFDAATGALRWTYDGLATGTDPPSRAWSGPIAAGRVVVALGPSTVGLDAASGRELWKGPGCTQARKWTHAGTDYVLLDQARTADQPARVVCLDAATGQEQWRADVDLLLGMHLPVVAGDRLIGFRAAGVADPGTANAVVAAYTLASTGLTPVWSAESLRVTDTIGLTVVDQVVYVAGAGEVRALDAASGKTLGQTKFDGWGRGLHLFAADGRLLLQPEAQSGRQILLQLTASPADPRVVGSPWTPPHAPTSANAAMPLGSPVVDGRLFLRGHDGLYAYDLCQP